jgi:hypothetical protein
MDVEISRLGRGFELDLAWICTVFGVLGMDSIEQLARNFYTSCVFPTFVCSTRLNDIHIILVENLASPGGHISQNGTRAVALGFV